METNNNINKLDIDQNEIIDSSELLSKMNTLDDEAVKDLSSVLSDDINSEIEESLVNSLNELKNKVENGDIELSKEDKSKLYKLFSSLDNNEEKLSLVNKYTLQENLEKLEKGEKLDEEVITAIRDYIKDQRENYDSEEMEELFQKIETEIDFSIKTLSDHKNNIEKFLYQSILDTIVYRPEEQINLIKKIDEYLENNYEKLDSDNSGNFNEQERIDMANGIKNIVTNLLDGREERLDIDLRKLIKNNFKIDHSVEFDFDGIINTSYRSIDNYNPKIDKNKDNSEILSSLVDYYRGKGSTLKVLNKDLNKVKNNKLENTPEENNKLLEIINEFYEKNKDIIKEELGVENISNLTPQQATKLVSFITMSKLDYDHGQALHPSGEKRYYENSDESEKIQYKKDLLASCYGAIFVGLFNSKNEDIISKLHTDLDIDNIDIDISKITPDEIKDFVKKDFLNKYKDKFNEIGIESYSQLESNINDSLGNTRNLDDEYFSRSEMMYINDNKSVSELLEGGDGICRNYAIANEKLFEALKTIQNPEDNKLKDSVLIYYSGNEEEESTIKGKISNSEKGSQGHAWNTLITIGADGNHYISQIDATRADSSGTEGGISKGGDIKDVKSIDRTFDRLLNDVADKTTDLSFGSVEGQLNAYINGFEKSGGDISSIIKLKNKMIKFYEGLGKTEKVDEIISSISSISSNIVNNSKTIKEAYKSNKDSGINNPKIFTQLIIDKFGENIDLNNLNDSIGLIACLRNLPDTTGGATQAQEIYKKSFMQNNEYKNFSKEEKISFIESNIDSYFKYRFIGHIEKGTFEV